MRFAAFAVAAAASLAGATALSAQTPDVEIQSSCCKEGRDARPWPGLREGVRWERSLPAATRRAAREGKPVLLFQLVGDLDKEGC